jgi:hypothetical protein
MSDDECRQLLKEEYLLLEKSIQDFDARALTIKTWSVSFSMAALVGAFATGAPAVLLLSAFASCLFWAIECMWKTFQYAFYERLNQIEDHFAGKGNAPAPLQIGRAWYDRWSKLGAWKFTCIMAWPRVALPHAAVVFLGLVLFLLHAAGVIRL